MNAVSVTRIMRAMKIMSRMKRMCAVACAIAVTCVSAWGDDTIPQPQSVGLVLSGGGAKGVAHIGVLQALEDNDIPIDYITGTSMGAIVGGLYAAGYTPQEMMRLLASRDFSYWSTGTIDKTLTYYFLQDAPTPTMLTLNLGDGMKSRGKPVLPSSLINPLPMNFAFMDLFSAYTAQCGGDFNKLFVPLRTVASDVTGKRKVVCSHGSLGDAIRASMSFPLVFQPIDMDGKPMYDGGIYDNFPVDVMRDVFAPEVMIGVDVSASDESADKSDMLSQLETMIIQHSDYSLPEKYGVKIRVELDEFGLLDFAKAQEIYRIGYDRAMAMMDSIKGRVRVRIPSDARRLRREVFKSQTPYVRFDSVSVSGGNQSQNAYIRYLFTHNRPDTFGLAQARDAFYRAITPGKFRNLMPTAVFNDTTRMFRLDLKATLKDNVELGVGGYLTTSTNSMLFLSGAYRTLNFNSLDLRLNGWIGQSYLAAEVSGQVRLLRKVPSSLQLQGVVSRQKYFPSDKFFFQTSEPTVLTSDEFFGRASYGLAVGRSGKAVISIGYGHVEHKYYHLATAANGRYHDLITQNLAEAVARYEYNTLNSASMPTAGAYYRMSATGVAGRHYFTAGGEGTDNRCSGRRVWGQAEVLARNYWDIAEHFAFGTEINVLASTRKLLPTYAESIVDAPEFNPSPSFHNVFAPGFRANSYAAVGVIPIWKLSSMLQFRGKFDAFVPFRRILPTAEGGARYGNWFSHADFFGQIEAVVTLPFASITAYSHYASVPEGRWNFGLSFGIFLLAPKFLR